MIRRPIVACGAQVHVGSRKQYMWGSHYNVVQPAMLCQLCTAADLLAPLAALANAYDF